MDTLRDDGINWIGVMFGISSRCQLSFQDSGSGKSLYVSESESFSRNRISDLKMVRTVGWSFQHKCFEVKRLCWCTIHILRCHHNLTMTVIDQIINQWTREIQIFVSQWSGLGVALSRHDSHHFISSTRHTWIFLTRKQSLALISQCVLSIHVWIVFGNICLAGSLAPRESPGWAVICLWA